MIFDSSLTGKNPPDEISVKAKLRESNDLMDDKFKTTKIRTVNPEYKRKTFIVCFKISELLNEIKLVNVFLKLSS